MTDTAKVDGKFAAGTQVQLDAVRAKLAAVNADLEAISGKVPHAALRVTLSNPEPGDQEVLDRQADLERQLHLLRQAERAAEQAERMRQAGAAYQSDAARHRALQQHLGRMHKSAMKFSAAATNANSALVDMLDAARSAYATLPAPMQRSNAGPLTSGYLSRIARGELGRLDAHNPYDARLFHHAPWTGELRKGSGWIILAELVQQHVDGLKAMAARYAIPDPDAEPAAEPVQPAEAPAATDVPETANTATAGHDAPPPAPRKPVPPLNLSINLSSVPMEPA